MEGGSAFLWKIIGGGYGSLIPGISSLISAGSLISGGLGFGGRTATLLNNNLENLR
jgi:hypothetical protein